MKLCKDCAHLYGDMWCRAPKNGISRVTGEYKVALAHLNRKYDCGEDAKFFTQKQAVQKKAAWWNFWKKIK